MTCRCWNMEGEIVPSGCKWPDCWKEIGKFGVPLFGQCKKTFISGDGDVKWKGARSTRPFSNHVDLPLLRFPQADGDVRPELGLCQTNIPPSFANSSNKKRWWCGWLSELWLDVLDNMIGMLWRYEVQRFLDLNKYRAEDLDGHATNQGVMASFSHVFLSFCYEVWEALVRVGYLVVDSCKVCADVAALNVALLAERLMYGNTKSRAWSTRKALCFTSRPQFQFFSRAIVIHIVRLEAWALWERDLQEENECKMRLRAGLFDGYCWHKELKALGRSKDVASFGQADELRTKAKLVLQVLIT